MTRLIPLEDFFKNPEQISVNISPNGEYLAWMEPYERRLNVFVKNIKTGEIKRITGATERDIAGYVWASDDRSFLPGSSHVMIFKPVMRCGRKCIPLISMKG